MSTGLVFGISLLHQVHLLHEQLAFGLADLLANHILRFAVSVEEDCRPHSFRVRAFEENIVDLDVWLFSVQTNHTDFFRVGKLKEKVFHPKFDAIILPLLGILAIQGGNGFLERLPSLPRQTSSRPPQMQICQEWRFSSFSELFRPVAIELCRFLLQCSA